MQDIEIGGRVVRRRERVQSGDRVVRRGLIKREVYSREETYRQVDRQWIASGSNANAIANRV